MHATTCDYMADLVHNALEAGASRIQLTCETVAGVIRVVVSDNGCGMTPAQIQLAENPFFSHPGKHPKRRVGLGLPLLRQAVETTQGSMTIESAPNQGTTVSFSLDTRHWDAPPLGDMPGTFMTLMSLPGDYDLAILRHSDEDSYTIARHEIQEVLGDLENTLNLSLVRQWIAELEHGVSATSAPQAHVA